MIVTVSHIMVLPRVIVLLSLVLSPSPVRGNQEAALGIDLGDHRAVVSSFTRTGAQTLTNRVGGRSTPSAVTFTGEYAWNELKFTLCTPFTCKFSYR